MNPQTAVRAPRGKVCLQCIIVLILTGKIIAFAVIGMENFNMNDADMRKYASIIFFVL